MKKERQQKFLDELRRIPIVQVACERCGISRQTAYRWRQEDFGFADGWDKAIEEGDELVNDMAQSQLLQLIKEKHFGATRYWLDRRHKKFKRPPDPEPTEDEKRKRRYEHLSTEELRTLLEQSKENIKKLEDEL